MDTAIISLLATLIALMFGGFWLLWRTIHKHNTAIRKDMADQRQDHARLEGALETSNFLSTPIRTTLRLPNYLTQADVNLAKASCHYPATKPNCQGCAIAKVVLY